MYRLEVSNFRYDTHGRNIPEQDLSVGCGWTLPRLKVGTGSIARPVADIMCPPWSHFISGGLSILPKTLADSANREEGTRMRRSAIEQISDVASTHQNRTNTKPECPSSRPTPLPPRRTSDSRYQAGKYETPLLDIAP